MVQSLFNAARHGCADFGGQGLGRCLDDVVNRHESSSGCSDGLGVHPGHAPCAQQSNSDHDLSPLKASSGIPTSATLPVKPTKAEVFYFHEFIDAVVRTLTTKPRLFHAPKWSNFVRDQPGVDAHHAAFKA